MLRNQVLGHPFQSRVQHQLLPATEQIQQRVYLQPPPTTTQVRLEKVP
jgi:hypothetical protein